MFITLRILFHYNYYHSPIFSDISKLFFRSAASISFLMNSFVGFQLRVVSEQP